MGVTVNYTKGSGRAHLNKRLSKQQLAERRERQLLAEHKKEEAVKRAVRTTLGIRPLSPSSNIITVLSGKPWAFNHARRDTGDRRMVTTRLPEVPVAGGEYLHML